MKNYVKVLIILLFVSTAFILTNYDSPLSDEPLNYPSKISPTLMIERTYDNSKTLKGKAVAHLFDKNLNLVKIKDGGVYVNGLALALEHYITGGPYYETSGNYQIYLNTTNTITVKMSNGDEYNSEMRTQFQELHTFNIPATFNNIDDVQVSWEEIIPDNHTWLEFYYEDDTGAGSEWVEIPEDSVDTGSYTTPRENFTTFAGKTVRAKIVSEKFGTANEHFKPTATISSQFAVIVECHIN